MQNLRSGKVRNIYYCFFIIIFLFLHFIFKETQNEEEGIQEIPEEDEDDEEDEDEDDESDEDEEPRQVEQQAQDKVIDKSSSGRDEQQPQEQQQQEQPQQPEQPPVQQPPAKESNEPQPQEREREEEIQKLIEKSCSSRLEVDGNIKNCQTKIQQTINSLEKLRKVSFMAFNGVIIISHLYIVLF